MASSPTARTLALLRCEGYTAQVVERWNPHARIRQDLFGVIDVVAIRADETGVLGIQATSGDNVSARLHKAKDAEALRTWLAAGNRFEVWGWRKVKGRWTVRKVPITLADFEPVSAVPVIASSV